MTNSPTPATGRPTVVLVDDHKLVRMGVRSEIEGEFEIVGEAGDVETAAAMIHARTPDVVLLDVHLPGGAGGGGAEVIARAEGVPTRFLALSVSDAAEDVVTVIRAGARGYVTKAIGGADLVAALHTVVGGDAVFSPRLAGFVLDAFGASAPAPELTVDDELNRLSAREREVMQLIARGYTYREVARELVLSVKTIETHVSNVLRKLQLSNRHELTHWAAQRKLL